VEEDDEEDDGREHDLVEQTEAEIMV